MSTVVLTPDSMVEAGVAATYTGSLSTSNTYKFRNNSKTLLHFKKSGSSTCTVTVNASATIRGHAVAAQTFVVPATTGDVFAGPFSHDIYDDVNHDVTFTCGEITGLTVAVLQLP